MSRDGGAAVGTLLRLVRATGTWLRRSSLKPMLLLTLGCLVIKEQYPFSNFPMYSSFGESTYYVHLADTAGKPLPTQSTLGVSTPTLKKVYQTELRKEQRRLQLKSGKLGLEEKRVVGERLLGRLKAAPAARRKGPLRLYEVNISLRNGRIEKDAVLVAEVL